MKEHRITFLAIVLCIVCMAIPLTASAATISLSKTSSSMYTGATDEFVLTIDELPQGLAGYKLTATISSPAVAEISAVAFPGWASLSNTTTIPSSSVRISGADMSEAVEPGATNIVLGTITVKAKNTGTATLTFGNIQVDDDQGDLVESTAGSATITVTGTSSGGGGGGGGGGGSYYSTTTTTAATTNTTTTPTTSAATTAPTSNATGVQPAETGAQSSGEEPVATETTSAATTSAAAASAGSSLPLPLPLIIGFAIAVIAAVTLLYLAITKKL